MDDKKTQAQLTKICALLTDMNEKLETLVAAEMASMQANDMLMRAFQGTEKPASTEPFMRQRLLGGEGGRNP